MKATYYLSCLLLLPLGCMAQMNTPMNSLENETWETASQSTETGISGETKYRFLRSGNFAATTRLSSGAVFVDEWEGKYTYIPEKEEVYLTYKSFAHRMGGGRVEPRKRFVRKECIKLKVQADASPYEVFFYRDWEKKGSLYSPVGESTIHKFSTRISTEKGYKLSEAVDEKQVSGQPFYTITKGSSFSRQKGTDLGTNR